MPEFCRWILITQIDCDEVKVGCKEVFKRIKFKKNCNFFHLYDNDYSSIIDIYFYETFSTPSWTFSALAQTLKTPCLMLE